MYMHMYYSNPSHIAIAILHTTRHAAIITVMLSSINHMWSSSLTHWLQLIIYKFKKACMHNGGPAVWRKRVGIKQKFFLFNFFSSNGRTWLSRFSNKIHKDFWWSRNEKNEIIYCKDFCTHQWYMFIFTQIL